MHGHILHRICLQYVAANHGMSHVSRVLLKLEAKRDYYTNISIKVVYTYINHNYTRIKIKRQREREGGIHRK